MKKKLFAELMQSMTEALEHAQGKRELRTTVLPEPPRVMSAKDVRRMREQLNASQAVFAHFLNVSTQLVQAWEASRRRPAGPALRLLELGQRYPTAVFALPTVLQVRETANTVKNGAKVTGSTYVYAGAPRRKRASRNRMKK